MGFSFINNYINGNYRYALNKNDVKDTDSDEEIWEEDERRDIDDAVENLQQNIQKIKEDDENGMNEDRS